jgi:hypothetical protein
MKQLRRVKIACVILALAAAVLTTDCQWPVDSDAIRVEPAPGNALTYDSATQTVTSGQGKPAFVLDTPFHAVTNLTIDITAVNRAIEPNYDMVGLQAASGGELVRPVPSGNPGIKSRMLVWLFRRPIDGRITVYPVESSIFRINSMYVRGRLVPVPLLAVLAVLLVVFLVARWHLLRRPVSASVSSM